MGDEVPFLLRPGMARKFYVGEFWFETGRFAYALKPKASLGCRPEPGGSPARLGDEVPFLLRPGMARNFYVREFWFEAGRFADGFKPKNSLGCRPEPSLRDEVQAAE